MKKITIIKDINQKEVKENKNFFLLGNKNI